MNDTTENDNDKPQFLAQASAGERLRQAREAAGLTRGEIALQMRLSERKIQALEEDNYDIFPSEAFVSGYLRSYAKMLDLSESDFVRPVSSTQLPPALSSGSGKNKQASSMDLPVRMVTYAIVIVVFVSLAMWWISQRKQAEVEPSEQPVAAHESANRTAEPVANAESTEEVATVQADSTAPDENLDAVTEAEPATVNEAEPQQVESSPQAEPEVKVKVKQTKPVPQDPAAPPMVIPQADIVEQQSPTVTAEEVPLPPPLADDVPRSKLVLEYQSDSWTEVSDSAGRQLVYGLMRAGRTIEIKGEAPFRVFLGFAEGVTIHYNGQLFEHAAFRRGEVARFRVGRAEHNKPVTR